MSKILCLRQIAVQTGTLTEKKVNTCFTSSVLHVLFQFHSKGHFLKHGNFGKCIYVSTTKRTGQLNSYAIIYAAITV